MDRDTVGYWSDVIKSLQDNDKLPTKRREQALAKAYTKFYEAAGIYTTPEKRF